MPSSTKREPPKRTRRVAMPFDARLEVRMYSTEKQKLDEEAAQRGMSASDLVRFQLGDLITADPPVERKAERTVPLVRLLEAACGLSRGQAVLKVELGCVALDGHHKAPYKEQTVPLAKVDNLRLDGGLIADDCDDLQDLARELATS